MSGTRTSTPSSQRWAECNSTSSSSAAARLAASSPPVSARTPGKQSASSRPGQTTVRMRAERQLRTRRPTDDELLPWGSAFLQAGGDASIVNPLNAVGSVRWNAAFAYLDPARNRPNLAILADTLGDRVLLDGERAVGVAT